MKFSGAWRASALAVVLAVVPAGAQAETLRQALESPRYRLLQRFAGFPHGMRFLVDLRADLLHFVAEDPLLKPLDRELETRLSAWFDVGFLELQRITWTSPAALLEKLVEYEAVHEIRSWKDLKNRLDSDRRCYAFFHPRMPLEPLIFVEVALTDRLAENVQALLDEQHGEIVKAIAARDPLALTGTSQLTVYEWNTR